MTILKPTRGHLSRDERLAEVVEAITAEAAELGRAVDLAAACRNYPEHAEELRRLAPVLAALDEMGLSLSRPNCAIQNRASGDSAERGRLGTLGDYRLLREVGRGGMGVVYEAQQISLSRRVALKVLPFAGVLDQRALQRFKNEAQAAAALDHPHIVDLYGIGSERGVHYYAMRFVEGPTLADCIRQLQENQADNVPRRFSSLAEVVADSTARAAITKPELTDDQPTTDLELSPAILQVTSTNQSTGDHRRAQAPHVTRRSRSPSFHSPGFFRSVAELGAVVAEALHHAHESGVTHRDIKPSNLLLDSQGKCWVTDFGLARIGADPAMTMTGDLLGTIRYMSPEQALAKRVVVDHRTDIYSLGVTLYELLTLQVPFPGENRQELLRQVAFEEPPVPRKLNRVIPAELETIVLKCLEKNPADRYATAADLAADLRAVLAHQPIQARRPGPIQRVRKWSRRHRVLVATACLGTLLALGIVVGMLSWRAHERTLRRNNLIREIDTALDEAAQLRGRAEQTKSVQTWKLALSAANRAQGFLAAEELDPRVHERVTAANDDVRRELHAAEAVAARRASDRAMVEELEELRHPSDEETAAKYADAFRRFGINILELPSDEAGRRIAQSRIGLDLIVALGDWASCAPPAGKKVPLQAALAADGSVMRQRIYRAMLQSNLKSMLDIANSAELAKEDRATFVILARALFREQDYPAATPLLIRGSQLFPADAEMHFLLGWSYMSTAAFYEEAERSYKTASTLASDRAGISVALAWILRARGCPQESREILEGLLEKHPNSANIWQGLSETYSAQGDFESAIDAAQKVVAFKPGWFGSYAVLSAALMNAKHYEEAEEACRRGLQVDPDSGALIVNLAGALGEQGRFDEEATRFFDETADRWRATIDNSRRRDLLVSVLPMAYWNLADSALAKGEVARARELCDRGLALTVSTPDLPDFAPQVDQMAIIHKTLAVCLLLEGNHARAAVAASDSARARAKGETVQWSDAMALLSRCITIAKADATLGEEEKAAAIETYRHEFHAVLEERLANNAGDLEIVRSIAQLLANVREPSARNTSKAVRLAEVVVTASPNNPTFVGTLGIALYRDGRYLEAIEVLERRCQLGSLQSAGAFFFLAMAHWQLGHEAEAQSHHGQGIAWMNAHDPKELHDNRLRSEVEELLGFSLPQRDDI